MNEGAVMRHRTWIGATTCIVLLAALSAVAEERQMNVRQGPETVFDQPVGEIFPLLANATATNENGRVGGELVFWGYRLPDDRRAFLFACARGVASDCEERIPAICPAPARTDVLETGVHAGKLVRRVCREACIVTPGDLRPCCTDRTERVELSIGLVQCT
jgi:hypothetical protein